MQKLLMPFKKQMMLCGYKNPEYKKNWGYHHYGADISTIQGDAGKNHIIYASGEGIVAAVGRDNSLGWGIAVIYRDCLNHKTGEIYDLTARYMHMSECYVAQGQRVSAATPLALEGKEGTGDYHLHIEFDTDVDAPLFSPQVSKGHSFWKKGTDSTVDPSFVLHTATERVIVEPTYNPEWLNRDDFIIPFAENVDTEDYKALYHAARNKLEKISEIINNG